MTDEDEDFYDFEGDYECLHHTDKAILVRKVGDTEPGSSRWIPQSCIHDDSEVYSTGHVGKLVVKRWYAEKNKLIKGD